MCFSKIVAFEACLAWREQVYFGGPCLCLSVGKYWLHALCIFSILASRCFCFTSAGKGRRTMPVFDT